MAVFRLAFQRLLKVEGLYSNDPEDAGGETFMGISRKFFPAWEGWEYVDRQEWKEARRLVESFYYHEFWEKYYLDLVKEQEVAETIFFAVVNMNPLTAVRLLQKALRIAGRKNLEIDGILGKKTLWAINTTDPDRLLVLYRGYLAWFYVNQVEERGYGEKFLYGWLKNRVKIKGWSYAEETY